MTVQTQVRKLMDESGFGRDRAVAAVLREIAVPEQNPSDTQVSPRRGLIDGRIATCCWLLWGAISWNE